MCVICMKKTRQRETKSHNKYEQHREDYRKHGIAKVKAFPPPPLWQKQIACAYNKLLRPAPFSTRETDRKRSAYM